MNLSTTKLSGSTSDDNLAVAVEDGNDILRECAGGCGKKILFFGFPDENDWGENLDGALCLECKSNPLKHTPYQE